MEVHGGDETKSSVIEITVDRERGQEKSEKGKQSEQALVLFSKMQEDGIVPDVIIYNALT